MKLSVKMALLGIMHVASSNSGDKDKPNNGFQIWMATMVTLNIQMMTAMKKKVRKRVRAGVGVTTVLKRKTVSKTWFQSSLPRLTSPRSKTT